MLALDVKYTCLLMEFDPRLTVLLLTCRVTLIWQVPASKSLICPFPIAFVKSGMGYSWMQMIRYSRSMEKIVRIYTAVLTSATN